jgi:hypothetical protein
MTQRGINRVSGIRQQYAVEQLPKLWLEITRPARASRFKQIIKTHKAWRWAGHLPRAR